MKHMTVHMKYEKIFEINNKIKRTQTKHLFTQQSYQP